MKKSLIAIIAALVLLCSIVTAVTACGKKESDSASVSSESEPITDTETTSETTDEELQPSAGLSYRINKDEKSCTVSRGVCADPPSVRTVMRSQQSPIPHLQIVAEL